jgi:hypothetical protein
MIHYHGGPVSPLTAAVQLWTRRHAFVSFERPEQIGLAAEICQSYAADNGAFSKWRKGEGRVDLSAYAEWIRKWMCHPGFDFCIIPDVIDGTEEENDLFISHWQQMSGVPLWLSVPVWHLHEPLERLKRLCADFPRVGLGSSGQYAQVNTREWWNRMGDAMDFICDEQGRPPCKLHGLRMLNPTVFSHLPLASADSVNAAFNSGVDTAWSGPYDPLTRDMRVQVMAHRIECHASAARWTRTRGIQPNLELVG